MVEIVSGYEIDNTTLTLGTDNTIGVNLTNLNNIIINASQATLSGTTAGSIVYSMPFQGTSYKKFVAYANGYENDTTTAQSITFPTAFINAPIIVVNSTGLTLSANTTTLTISAPDSTATYTGWIIIEGY